MRGTLGRHAALAGLLLAALAGGAWAHDVSAERPTTPGGRAALARHDNFQRLGQAFQALADELKRPQPNRAAVARHAATVNSLSADIPAWFPKGSGQEARPDSEAKANIWTDAAGFSAAAATSAAQAAKLQQLSNGELGAMRAQVRDTDAACKACHAQFRETGRS